MAPMYIGPAVNGCGPQYIGIALAISLTFVCPIFFRTATAADLSGSTGPAEEPPLKLGIIRLGSSSQPYDQAVAYSI